MPFKSSETVISGYLVTSPKTLGCQPPTGYDLFLMQTTATNKMPIGGLEMVEAELAALDSQPFDKQIEALNKLANDPEKYIAASKKSYDAYLAQNLPELFNLTITDFKEDGMSQAKLLDDRNKSWIPVIEKNISEKPSFIAVGGGHLGGEKGVVNLLRKKGYKLTPIKF